MNQFAAVTLGVAALALLGPVRAQSPAEVQLTAIQKEWAEARVKADVAYLERLYAKDFRVQTIAGNVASREDDIAMFRDGHLKPEYVRNEDLKVSIYGQVGVVTGIENVAGTYQGQYGKFSIRFTNVFVQRGGRWQLVLSQGTAIPPQ